VLEIIILYLLGKKIAAMCNDRGRTAWPWVVFMVLGWYGGAIVGVVVAMVIMLATDPNAQEPNMALLIAFGLGGAVAAVGFVTLVVSLLPPVERFEDEDEYDEDLTPRRRRMRYDDEDSEVEDDRPRRRRRRDEDDEYDREDRR
jgi:hypothetical protein